MSLNSMTNSAIAAEVGRRIEQMRLEQNLTQQQVADEIGLSRVSYRKLAGGMGKFENIIAVLRVLGGLDLIQPLITETTFSPIEQLKLKGKQRQRATGVGVKNVDANAKKRDVKKPAPRLDW